MGSEIKDKIESYINDDIEIYIDGNIYDGNIYDSNNVIKSSASIV